MIKELDKNIVNNWNKKMLELQNNNKNKLLNNTIKNNQNNNYKINK